MGALYMIWEEELEDAFAEGKEEGKEEHLVEKTKIKLAKGQSVAQIAEALEEKEDVIQKLIDEYAL